jgi:hypothetical protein
MVQLAINLYHTSCKMTVNGSRIDIFINELFDLIYKKNHLHNVVQSVEVFWMQLDE